MERFARYQWLIALAVWIGVCVTLELLRFTPYGIDEAAARSLLINWTVAEQIANPILVLGTPDFRSLLFLPMGAYWPGSMVAVKVFTAILFFLAVTMIYFWAKEKLSSEAALIACGLLLINPVSLQQINALGPAPYLLLLFAVGVWADKRYRAANRQLAGWYFLQIFIALTAVSIHPLGLGYPLGLAWEWWRNPVDRRQQRQFFIGLGIASLLILVLRFGWPQLEWLHNPLRSLGMLLVADVPDAPTPLSAWWGALPVLALAATLVFCWRDLSSTLWGRILITALVAGIITADAAWAMCALLVILLFGFSKLLKATSGSGASFVSQRGFAFGIIFILTTTSMIGDKNYRAVYARDGHSPQDRAIHLLASEMIDAEEAVHIGSQWPGRTMLATHQPSFPLPPADRGEQLVSDAAALDYLIFNPYEPDNKALTDAISDATALFETVSVDDRVVLIRVRKESPAPQDASAGSGDSNTSSAAPNGSGE